MMRNKKIALLAIVLVASLAVGVFAATYQMWFYQRVFTVIGPTTAAVQYTVIEDWLPDNVELDKPYLMKVQCKNTATIPYDVTAKIVIYGPAGFDNNDISIRWSTWNDTAGAWVKFWDDVTEFTIGRAGTGGTFSGSGTITWTGTPTTMGAGVVCTHYVYVTILGSAPTGGYTAQISVDGTGV